MLASIGSDCGYRPASLSDRYLLARLYSIVAELLNNVARQAVADREARRSASGGMASQALV